MCVFKRDSELQSRDESVPGHGWVGPAGERGVGPHVDTWSGTRTDLSPGRDCRLILWRCRLLRADPALNTSSYQALKTSIFARRSIVSTHHVLRALVHTASSNAQISLFPFHAELPAIRDVALGTNGVRLVKWDKSGIFYDQFSVHFGSLRLKIPRFVLFRAIWPNFVQFWHSWKFELKHIASRL